MAQQGGIKKLASSETDPGKKPVPKRSPKPKSSFANAKLIVKSRSKFN